jgi:hypothetical protein
LGINLWNPENLEFAVRTVSFTASAKLNGIAPKEVKRIFAASCAILMAIV